MRPPIKRPDDVTEAVPRRLRELRMAIARILALRDDAAGVGR